MSIVGKIEFENNPDKVCYSGQLLKGSVQIYFPVNTFLNEIYIKFAGQGFCQWPKDHSGRFFQATVEYLNIQKELLNRSNGNEDVVVPAGNNEYPFEIELPSSLPTSLEGSYGYIRYIVTLHTNPKIQETHALEEDIFTVIKPLNLNISPSYRIPKEVAKVVEFRNLWLLGFIKDFPLSIMGRMPVTGYSPGQIINLKLDVINRSCQDVDSFQVDFVKEIIYQVHEDGLWHTKFEKIPISENKLEGCKQSKSSIQTRRVNVIVPSIPPTDFNTANICRVRYMFLITAVVGSWHRDPEFEIPVIIGTYPVSNEVYSAAINTAVSQSVETELPSTSESATIDGLCELPPYPDSDPPTYEEAMQSGTIARKANFAPKYPVYRRTTSYSSEDYQ